MSLKRVSEREDIFARHYQYDDEELLVADLGVADEDATVDVVDDVAIVVVADEDEPRQLELELPDGGAEAFITNGVLTIGVRR